MIHILLKKSVNFNFISGPNYENYRRKMSLEALLTEYIFDFSVLHIVNIDDVTSMFNREDQCREKNQRDAV